MKPDQFTLDLDGLNPEIRMRGQFLANQERDAKNWSTEAMAMVWVLGVSDWDWWNSFPEYERTAWLHWYENAQISRRGPRACDMQTFASYKAQVEDSYNRNLEIASAMAKEIRHAWLHNEPCPISAGDLSGPDLERFNHMLEWANRISQSISFSHISDGVPNAGNANSEPQAGTGEPPVRGQSALIPGSATEVYEPLSQSSPRADVVSPQ